MKGFAVVDVETTGLSHRNGDRVLELAIVLVDPTGKHVQERWSTMFNPERSVGRADIHGIRSADALKSPRFETILGDIAVRLQNRVLVAHNATFDWGFLDAEFRRAGFDFPIPKELTFCTMKSTRTFLPTQRHRLVDCCEYLGIDNKNAHSALSDAVATAAVLGFCLDENNLKNDAIRKLQAASKQDVQAYPLPANIQNQRKIDKETVYPPITDHFSLSEEPAPLRRTRGRRTTFENNNQNESSSTQYGTRGGFVSDAQPPQQGWQTAQQNETLQSIPPSHFTQYTASNPSEGTPPLTQPYQHQMPSHTRGDLPQNYNQYSAPPGYRIVPPIRDKKSLVLAYIASIIFGLFGIHWFILRKPILGLATLALLIFATVISTITENPVMLGVTMLILFAQQISAWFLIPSIVRKF